MVADDGQGIDPRRVDSDLGGPPGRRLRPTARRREERYPRYDRGLNLAGARTILVELRAQRGSRQNS
jgi:hypothetical protein